MKHLVILTTLPYTEAVIERIRAVSPRSSVIDVTKLNLEDAIQRVQTRPLYSENYWVLAHCENRALLYKDLKKLYSVPWVRIAYLCPYKGIYNEIRDHMIADHIDYALFNCYKVNYFSKLKYVSTIYDRVKLDPADKLSNEIRHYIAKRLQGHENQLEFYMSSVLNRYGKITKRNIGRMMPLKSYVTLNNYIFTLLDPEATPEQVGMAKQLIAKYQSYPYPLIRSTLEFFDQWDILYTEFITGRFNEDTFSHWLTASGQEFKVTSQFIARRWLGIFTRYSYAFLSFIRYQLQTAYRQSNYCAYVQILQITKALLTYNKKE